MMKNRNILIGAIVVLVVVIILGGIFLLAGHNQAASSTASDSSQTGSQEQTVGTLTPADIGLQMVLSPDDKKIKFTADKLDGVKTLEWNFTYDADIPASDQTADNAGSKVTQEFGSDQPVNVVGKISYESPFRELGTCSSGHCRYDTGITSVSIVMKVTKTDGNVYQIKDSISMPQ